MSFKPGISEILKSSKPFVSPLGNCAPQTVKIIFKEEFRGLREMELGYFPQETINNYFSKQEDINLDYCYIDYFSLAEYRKEKNLDKKHLITLKNISAKFAIVDPYKDIDLSYAVFENAGLSFDHAVFLRGQVSFHSLEIKKGSISFADCLLHISKLDLANASVEEGTLNFKNAIFSNSLKDFQYFNFGNGEVIFTNTDFGDGDVSFINSTFGESEISFKVARFGTGKVDFHYAHFKSGDISFERTDFGNGFVDFRKIEWNNNRVNFNRSVFGSGGVSFEESELKQGKFSFKKASFKEGNIDFASTIFENIDVTFESSDIGKCSLNFNKSRFGSLSLRNCHIDNYADLRFSYIGFLDLSNTVVRDIVDIKPIENEVKIKLANFEGMRLIGRLYIGWNENKVLSLIANQENTSLHAKAEQFRTLKQNFNQTGQYNDEDDAYVYFKRYESLARLDDLMQKSKWNAFAAYPEYGFKWLVFDKIGLYATSPLRVLVAIIFIYVFFGLMLFMVQIYNLGSITSAVGNPDHLSILSQSFYHSAITFFTIGYGDTYPQGLDRILSALEGFTGVFMMSYFTVAFVRKILR